MAKNSSVSAVAQQMVVVAYPEDLPERTIPGKEKYSYLTEITMSTEQAVDLYNQLKVALGL